MRLWLHTTDDFDITAIITVKNPDGETHGLPKHVGEDFMHLLFIYSSSRKVSFKSSHRNALVSTGLAHGLSAIFFEHGNKSAD